MVHPFGICAELPWSFPVIYSKSQNMAVREVTGYKLDSPCSNHGEVFELIYLCTHYLFHHHNTETFVDSSSFYLAGVRLHFLNFKESCFLRSLNVCASRAAEMTFNLFTLSACGTLEQWRTQEFCSAGGGGFNEFS